MLGGEGPEVGVPARRAGMVEGLDAEVVGGGPEPVDAAGVGGRRRGGEAVLSVHRLHRAGDASLPEERAIGGGVAGERARAAGGVGRIGQRRDHAEVVESWQGFAHRHGAGAPGFADQGVVTKELRAFITAHHGVEGSGLGRSLPISRAVHFS